MNQREKDILILERTVAFEERLADYFKNYEGERGKQWPEEENETTPLEQETPLPPLPSNLA